MKVGSKVMYIGGKNSAGAMFLNEHDVYTVKSIFPCNSLGIPLLSLVEVSFGVCSTGDVGLPVIRFREIDDTPGLSETTVEELIEQLELTPQTI